MPFLFRNKADSLSRKTPKMGKACQECRASNRKCSHVDSSGSCAQCLKSGLSCSSMLIRGRRDSPLTPRDPGAGVDQEDAWSIDLHIDTIIELVEHYIDKLHDRPHSLFHLPTLRESVLKRTIKKALLLAICSLGSRFSTQGGRRPAY